MLESTNQPTSVNDVLGVLGGNRDIKVGLYKDDVMLLGVTMLVAMFIAVLLAHQVSKRL